MAHARGALQISVCCLLGPLRPSAQQAILASGFSGFLRNPLALLVRHVFIFFAPRFAASFAELGHQLAPG